MTTVKEELEEAWDPNDMVLAVLEDTSRSTEVCQALQAAGFAREDIAVFQGDEIVEHLDMEGKRSDNPFTRPLRLFWSYFSIEGPQLRPYEEAGKAGMDILAVRAAGDDIVDRAHQMLKQFGATEIRYFTQWNISDLADSNSGA